MSNVITYDKRIANLLKEELPKNPNYHTSATKIKKIIGALFKMDNVKLMFDSRIVNKRSVPDNFIRFEINYGGVLFTHMINEGYSDEEKIYHTVGEFLQDIKKI